MECVICLLEKKVGMIKTHCGHIMCSDCYGKLYDIHEILYDEDREFPCPICRTDLKEYLPCNFCSTPTLYLRFVTREMFDENPYTKMLFKNSEMRFKEGLEPYDCDQCDELKDFDLECCDKCREVYNKREEMERTIIKENTCCDSCRIIWNIKDDLNTQIVRTKSIYQWSKPSEVFAYNHRLIYYWEKELKKKFGENSEFKRLAHVECNFLSVRAFNGYNSLYTNRTFKFRESIILPWLEMSPVLFKLLRKNYFQDVPYHKLIGYGLDYRFMF